MRRKQKLGQFRFGVFTVAALVAMGLPSRSNASNVDWLGATNTQWSVSSNWSSFIVPDDLATDVLIQSISPGQPFSVELDMSANVHSVAIGSADTLTVRNGHVLTTFESIATDGILNIGSMGSYGILNVVGHTTLSGAGQTVLSDNPNNYIDSSNGSTLTIAAGHTLTGGGRLGGYWGSSLNIVNQGTMVSSGSNGLIFYGNVLDNAGGLIQIADNSTLNVASGIVVGGAIEGLGPGGATLVGSFKDITINGHLQVTNGNLLTLTGHDQVNGVLNIGANGSYGIVNLTGNTTLTGTGQTVLSDNPNNYVDSANGSTLTIAAGHVVKGSGHLGGYWGSSLNIVNQGTIVSDGGNGLMFYGNVLDNTAGLIDITQGSFFNAASGTVSGGVIRGHGIEALYGTNFQNLTVQGGLMLNTGTFTNVVFKDTNTITNGNVITMAGTTTVDGSLVLGTQGSYGVINLTGNTTLTGTGQTVLSDNPNNYIDSANGSTLTIAAGHVVKGSGHLGGYWSTTLKVLNQGRIEASGANPLYAYTDSSDGFINQGFVQVNAGNTMIFQGGARLVQDREAAITTVNGELYSSVLDLRAGVLSGRGTITGNVVNAGGTVAPGTSPGTLSVLGDYTQGAAGNLLIEIDGFDQGLSYDWLSILGDANLAGNLYLDIGFHPADGSTFTFLTTTNGAVTGSFEHVYAAGWNVETTYTLNSVSVTLTATAVPEPQAFALLMAGLLVVGAGLRSRQHRTQR